MNKLVIKDKIAENDPLPSLPPYLISESNPVVYEGVISANKKYSAIKARVFAKDVATLLVCLDSPRNEIDNPIRYCTQGFQASISSFIASSLVGTLPREYQSQKLASLWKMSMRWLKESKSSIEANLNIFPGGWAWFQFEGTRTADFFVAAYINNKISADLAIQLSGLSEIDFAKMVQEKAMRRDQLVFHEYLKGEDVDNLLPFSEEKSSEFRGVMANEIE